MIHMVGYYERAIAPAVETLVTGKQENRFTIVKHYNTFEITAQDAEKLKEEHPHLYVCYRHFNGSKMISAFEVKSISDIHCTCSHRFYDVKKIFSSRRRH